MKDNDIIHGIRENSEAAWRALYAATHDLYAPMFSQLLKGKSIETFDDIYELACIDLMDSVKTGRLKEGEKTNLAGYLFTVCLRRAIRSEKSRRTELVRKLRMVIEKDEQEASEKYSPDAMLEFDPEEEKKADQKATDEALAFLDKVLASIPERCRAILRRLYWDKMTMKVVAAAMGLKNDDVAKATKNKCMNKFKSMAKEMLADDVKAEEAVRRVVERDALRDLLEEFRKESSGEWARAALDDEDEKKD